VNVCLKKNKKPNFLKKNYGNYGAALSLLAALLLNLFARAAY
jgi:hypothetical protein